MRGSVWSLSGGVLLAACLARGDAAAEPLASRSAAARVFYAVAAAVANVVPGPAVLVAPKCIQGYVLCKFSFAALSVVAAGEQLLMSGGSDGQQTRAILYRGFAGDWYVTAGDMAGITKPDVFPESPPPTQSETGDAQGFIPPPL